MVTIYGAVRFYAPAPVRAKRVPSAHGAATRPLSDKERVPSRRVLRMGRLSGNYNDDCYRGRMPRKNRRFAYGDVGGIEGAA